MTKISTLLLAASISAALAGCASTTDNTLDETTPITTPSATLTTSASVNPQVYVVASDNVITLKQIMSDPQWLGRQPTQMGWSIDGRAIVFEREKPDSDLYDVYAASIDAPASAEKVALGELHHYRFDERVVRDDGVVAFRFEDSVFVQFTDGNTVQLTRG